LDRQAEDAIYGSRSMRRSVPAESHYGVGLDPERDRPPQHSAIILIASLRSGDAMPENSKRQEIKRIQAQNFKGFRRLDISLRDLNVLIGANASGKTTIVEVLRFVRDIGTQGLDNAISLQGGVKYLRNLNLAAAEELTVSLLIGQKIEWRFIQSASAKDYAYAARADEINHTLKLRFKKRGLGYEVADDLVTADVTWRRTRRGPSPGVLSSSQPRDGDSGAGTLSLRRVNGKVKFDGSLPVAWGLQAKDVTPPYLSEVQIPKGSTVAFGSASYYLLPSAHPMGYFGLDVGIYDFDPKLPKRAAQITGRAELEEDGRNLALVLKDVRRDKEKRRKLTNLLLDLLPFVEDIDVENFADKSLLFKVQEKYFPKDQYLPASSASDGTINVTALVLALYFEDKSSVVIEEPERNIHASLIAKVVGMMKDASRQRQVIITTHNPEIVKHAGVENLILLSRDADGFCIARRASESEQVKAFLSNELGIDELYVGNLLQA
jgi:predicted ATPase